ncbi:MAG TPA: hypothetical protein VE961_09570 [Pyrinomonadaceae bacterium]|nr:hypothetical protein [Pyrinomonadaceae bacterium]
MKVSDVVSVVATLLAAISACYLAFVAGDYAIALVVGVALPIVVAAVILVTRGSKKLIVIATFIGIALLTTTLLVRWKEQDLIEAYLDSIADANANYANTEWPPLPLTTDGRTTTSHYLSAFAVSKPTIAFVAGPAGSGKSALIKAMVGESYASTRAGTIFIQLSKIQEQVSAPRTPQMYGTQLGLGAIPTIESSNAQSSGLFGVLCQSQLQAARVSGEFNDKDFEKKWPFTLRTADSNQRRFTEGCIDRFKGESKKAQGLRIFLDDLDEIAEPSLLKLMTLVDETIRSLPPQPAHKVLIVLSGRPEVFYIASREKRSLWDESRDSSAAFALMTATIEPMKAEGDAFQDYLRHCVKFEVGDGPTLTSVVAAINAQRVRSTQLQEALTFADGCGFAARHFRALVESKTQFDTTSFARDFYFSWRARAHDKHKLPAIGDAKEYENLLKSAAAELEEGNGEAMLNPNLGVLMYSGLINVIPLDFGMREYKLRFEFPQFQAAILHPPWQKAERPAK